MSNIPEFHFNFESVQGLPFEDAATELFKQLETHYNAHIKPAPIIFGGAAVVPPTAGQITHIPASKVQKTAITGNETTIDSDIVAIHDWEIKEAASVGMKEGQFITGITNKGVDVFDKIINREENYVFGESAAYLLEEK